MTSTLRSFARLSLLMAALAGAPTALAQVPAGQGATWFARVAGVEIPAAEFDFTARETFRNKFYHGQPPEAEVNRMLREVGDMLIDRILLSRAAAERKISADPKAVEAEVGLIDKRYSAEPAWTAQREQTLPAIRAEIEGRHRHAALEKIVRDVSASTTEVRQFYDQNQKLFTEPTKNRVSLILFRVSPSAPQKEWEAAQKKAEETLAEIKAGSDFATLAKERSNDTSAPNGGDLGFMHEGMLAGGVEEALAKMAPGDLGGPTMTLEGYVIYRLSERTPPKLRDFASVEKRARDLYLRKKSDETWLAYLDSLRQGTSIEIGPAFERIMKTPPPGTGK